MRRFSIAFIAASAALICACTAERASPSSAHADTPIQEPAQMTEIAFTSIDGKPMPLSDYQGSAVLVVNTASKCGYTPQYKGLQELYETFSEQGLVVLGVPSNDFGAQEPGQEEEVKAFCELNYGVTFPLTKKYAVTGDSRHPFYTKAVAAIGEQAQPKWNFHKVLVGKDGTPIRAYPSATKPADAELIADIEAALAG